MFITVKRHEREKQELISASNRLTDAILKTSSHRAVSAGCQGQDSTAGFASLGTLFRRQDFSNLSFEKLIGPLVSAKTLSVVRTYIARLLEPARGESAASQSAAGRRSAPARMPMAASPRAHYSIRIHGVEIPSEPRTLAGPGQRHHRAGAAACANWRICAQRAHPRRNSAQRAAGRRHALRRVPAKNRRGDEDHQQRVEEAGTRGRRVSPASSKRPWTKSIAYGATLPRSNSTGLQAAAREFEDCAAGIAQPRNPERQRFPAPGRQARLAVRPIRVCCARSPRRPDRPATPSRAAPKRASPKTARRSSKRRSFSPTWRRRIRRTLTHNAWPPQAAWRAR